MSKVLIFAPHPDDEILGCGGSIIKHITKGDEVRVVFMTSGDAGSLDFSKEELSKIRENESKSALSKIGLNPEESTIFLRNPDGYLNYNQENLVKIINLIRQFQPDVVYMPHENDGHKDHMTTFQICSQAIGRAQGPWFQETEGKPWKVKKVICYEVWTPLTDYNYVLDITDVIDQKLEAMKEHKSQTKDIDYVNFTEGLSKYRRAQTGVGKYSECYKIISINEGSVFHD